jgi:predicted metal-dependent HD superfamily phosphohydrolase
MDGSHPTGTPPESTRLARAIAHIGGEGDTAALYDALVAAHAEPQRAYHTLDHVRACLALLEHVAGADPDRHVIEVALWFHDAVYDPRAHDNEARSADWAARELAVLGVPDQAISRVVRLIEATRHDGEGPPEDPAARLLVDLDLSILGEDGATFDAYEEAVRYEYAWVPDAAFREGRARVVDDFLARRPLYTSGRLPPEYERRARLNLARSRAALDERDGT